RARHTKAGGRIGLVNWTPGPGVADLFRIMSPFQPAPPPSNPFEWGDEDNVRRLLGDAFDLDLDRGSSQLRLPSGDEYWNLFSTSYGPTKTLAESLGDRQEELRHAWASFFDENNRENGGVVPPRGVGRGPAGPAPPRVSRRYEDFVSASSEPFASTESASVSRAIQSRWSR